jgi:hypothetical protein
VVRHLEDLGAEINFAYLVLTAQDAAGFVVQVAGEEEAEPAIPKTEDSRMTSDGVHRRKAFEALSSEIERFVADPRTFRGIAKDPEADGIALLGQERPENGDFRAVAVALR